MKRLLERQIIEAEEKLRLAMLDSDVNALNELLANELIFTNHLGQIFTKQDDINAHQSGIINIETITPSEQQIKLVDSNVAIVTVKVNIIGSYAGIKSNFIFRFTRVWHLSLNNIWQVIVAHSSVIN
jgi:ketosteroid isomerase-like protein